jgi:integrase
MARQNPLTELEVRALPHPEQGSTKHFDPSLPGFGVRCTVRSKSFFVMFGPERRLQTIGRWPQVSLKEARQEAKGILVAPPPKKRSQSFLEAQEAFLADCKTRLRPSTVDRYKFALKTITADTLADVPTTVTDPTILKTLKVFFNWCIDQELTDRNPFLRKKVVFVSRDRVLTDAELKAVWHYDHKPYSDLVKLLILTGQRRNQIWQYDPAWREGDIITFPAAIMKSGRPHTIPVTGYEAYLQSFTMNGWSKQKVRIDKHTGVTGWVLHDFRRYFSTTMARLGTPLHLTEHILDHRSSISGVAAIYNRYGFIEEMRFALDKYHQHIQSIVS